MPNYFGGDGGHHGWKFCVIDKSGHPVFIRSDHDESYWPSAVFLNTDGTVLFGEDARQQGLVYPDQVALDYKKHLGDDTKLFFGKKCTAEEVLTMGVKPLAAYIEKKTGRKIDGVVLTCPVDFKEHQVVSLKRAYEAAGIKVIQIITEPVAAAYSYTWRDSINPTRTTHILCVDLGHGTLDVAVIKIEKGEATPIACEGLRNVAGEAYSHALIELILEKVAQKTGKPVQLDKLSNEERADVTEKAEKAKRALSNQQSTKVALNLFGKPRLVEITQQEYVNRIAPLIEQLKACVDKTMAAAKKSWKDIDLLVLAGGPFNNGRLQSALADHTGLVPRVNHDPTTVVSYGAALHAYKQASEEGAFDALPSAPQLKSATDHDIGIGIVDYVTGVRRITNRLLIPKGTVAPYKNSIMTAMEHPHQTEVWLAVLQGPRGAELKDCAVLCEDILKGCPARPDLEQRLEMVMSLDKNRLATLIVTDKECGKSITLSLKVPKDPSSTQAA